MLEVSLGKVDIMMNGGLNYIKLNRKVRFRLEDVYKVYKILIKVVIGGESQEIGVGVTKNKKSYLIKDNSIYKVKSQVVESEGFEPSSREAN